MHLEALVTMPVPEGRAIFAVKVSRLPARGVVPRAVNAPFEFSGPVGQLKDNDGSSRASSSTSEAERRCGGDSSSNTRALDSEIYLPFRHQLERMHQFHRKVVCINFIFSPAIPQLLPSAALFICRVVLGRPTGTTCSVSSSRRRARRTAPSR
jgi:hypothetical protein